MSDCRVTRSMGVIYEREHFVQFYDRDKTLIKNLLSFVGAGIQAGDACVVICTPRHAAALDVSLAGAGLPTSHAHGYLWLDADAMLSKVTDHGQIEREGFRQVVGDLLHEASERGQSIRAFGEMVAQLWVAGNEPAAVRLEALWNELAADYALTLFCAYPIGSFACGGFDESSAPIRHLHSSAIAALPTG